MRRMMVGVEEEDSKAASVAERVARRRAAARLYSADEREWAAAMACEDLVRYSQHWEHGRDSQSFP